MDAKKLIEAAESAGYEPRSYSGRGMFGRSCVGIEVSRGQSEFTMAIEIAKELMDLCEKDDEAIEVVDELAQLRPSCDSMGLGAIVYFPGVPWPEDEDEDEDAEQAFA